MKAGLIIKFTDPSNSFAHGVEFGRILQKIESGSEIVDNNGLPVRIENKDVIDSTCVEYGYIPVWGTEYPGGWVSFMAIKKTSSLN